VAEKYSINELLLTWTKCCAFYFKKKTLSVRSFFYINKKPCDLGFADLRAPEFFLLDQAHGLKFF